MKEYRLNGLEEAATVVFPQLSCTEGNLPERKGGRTVMTIFSTGREREKLFGT